MSRSDARPWLSVLMPVYNGGALLVSALDSLVGSPLDDCEIIAVDNSSTDETADILARYSRSLPLRIVRQPHANSWLVGANRALREATGEFVCMLHHDDSWLPMRLQRLRYAQQAFPDIDFFAHAVYMIGPDGQRLGRWQAPLDSGRVSSRDLMRRLIVQNCFAAPAPMVRRHCLLRLGGFNESLWFTADWDLWLRLGSESDMVYLPEPLANYRIHASQQTVNRTNDAVALRAQLRHPWEAYGESWKEQGLVDSKISRAAALSVEVNVSLASMAAGGGVPWKVLLAAASSAGVSAVLWYARSARLIDRISPRIRVLLSQ